MFLLPGNERISLISEQLIAVYQFDFQTQLSENNLNSIYVAKPYPPPYQSQDRRS